MVNLIKLRKNTPVLSLNDHVFSFLTPFRIKFQGAKWPMVQKGFIDPRHTMKLHRTHYFLLLTSFRSN